jgi:hypothetical protein
MGFLNHMDRIFYNFNNYIILTIGGADCFILGKNNEDGGR